MSEWNLQNALMAYRSAVASMVAEDPDAEIEDVTGDSVAEIEAALRRIVVKIQDAQDMAAVARQRATEAGERARRFDARVARLKGVVMACMDSMGWRKREWAEATVSLRAPQPGVLITDETALPEGFIRVTRAPDKEAIRTALKGGAAVPGAVLANGSPSLAIKGT